MQEIPLLPSALPFPRRALAMSMIYAALSTYLSCANASYDEQRFEIRSQRGQQQKRQLCAPELEAKTRERFDVLCTVAPNALGMPHITTKRTAK